MYRCSCAEGWAGTDCSIALELSCNDNEDNDEGKTTPTHPRHLSKPFKHVMNIDTNVLLASEDIVLALVCICEISLFVG